MPWEHCEQSVNDNEVCPECGISKDEWTLTFGVTRNFKVSRRPIAKFTLLDAERGEPLANRAFDVRFPDGGETSGISDEYGFGKVPSGDNETYELSFSGLTREQIVAVEPEPATPAGEPSGEARLQLDCNQRYEIRLRVPFELVFQRHGEPWAGASYRLAFEGGERVGELDAEGVLREELPPEVTRVDVTVGSGDDQRSCVLEVGGLRPVEDARGLQQRLNNLGFRCGEEDGDCGTVTQDRLTHLQLAAGLPPTGQADATTVSKLLEYHGA